MRAREADIERIQQMFPQVPRRSIMWDLQRNGGNVVATTERVLSGRGLEVVSYFVILSRHSFLIDAVEFKIRSDAMFYGDQKLIMIYSLRNPSNHLSPHPPLPQQLHQHNPKPSNQT